MTHALLSHHVIRYDCMAVMCKAVERVFYACEIYNIVIVCPMHLTDNAFGQIIFSVEIFWRCRVSNHIEL